MATFTPNTSMVGQHEVTNNSSISSYIQQQTGVSINPAATPWCGYYAGAVLKEGGYSIPSNFGNSQSWLNYGQAVDSNSLQVGDVAVWKRDPATGYGHVGVVTGFDEDGDPIILSGNSSNKVDESAYTKDGLTFRRPVASDGTSPDPQQNGNGGTGANQPGGGSGSSSGGGSGSSSGGSSGGSQRKGQQDGNTDTQSSNSAVAKSGPICGGTDKPDIQGTPSNYRRTTVKSACTRVPTHEPFLGHPKTMLPDRQGLNGGQTPAQSGAGASPAPTGSGGGTPGAGAPKGGAGATAPSPGTSTTPGRTTVPSGGGGTDKANAAGGSWYGVNFKGGISASGLNGNTAAAAQRLAVLQPGYTVTDVDTPGVHTGNGYHYKGEGGHSAIDIRTNGMTDAQIQQLMIDARKAGFTGFGLSTTHLHIDMRPGGVQVFSENTNSKGGLSKSQWQEKLAGVTPQTDALNQQRISQLQQAGITPSTAPANSGSSGGTNGNATTTANQTLSPQARALLDTIAGTESPGYNVIYGGSRFSSYADHPRQYIPIRSGPNAGKTSSAAGRYQFIASTWDSMAKKLGLRDFSPGNQDAAAWEYAREVYKQKTGRDLQSDLASNNPNTLAQVAQALHGAWTSLPGGIETGTSMQNFIRRFQAAEYRYAQPAQNASVPTQNSGTTAAPTTVSPDSQQPTVAVRPPPNNPTPVQTGDTGKNPTDGQSPQGNQNKETTKIDGTLNKNNYNPNTFGQSESGNKGGAGDTTDSSNPDPNADKGQGGSTDGVPGSSSSGGGNGNTVNTGDGKGYATDPSSSPGVGNGGTGDPGVLVIRKGPGG